MDQEREFIHELIVKDEHDLTLRYIDKGLKAKELHVTTRTIDRMVKRGDLPFMVVSTSGKRWFVKGQKPLRGKKKGTYGQKRTTDN